ncbi:asparagine synthase-related protein [Streptomyces sp. MS1.HAVA.3]|uniref:Asparagine synthase-related protein n=1 Tax=Streptomyces caledonius TaxID=3134107 RepID=A0ABU8U7N6_9ACTN
MPRAYRKRLFWNKQVIREAVSDILPPEVISRPKLAFYEGEGVRHTHRTFTRMLAGGGDELVEEALSSPRAAQYLDGKTSAGRCAGWSRTRVRATWSCCCASSTSACST